MALRIRHSSQKQPQGIFLRVDTAKEGQAQFEENLHVLDFVFAHEVGHGVDRRLKDAPNVYSLQKDAAHLANEATGSVRKWGFLKGIKHVRSEVLIDSYAQKLIFDFGAMHEEHYKQFGLSREDLVHFSATQSAKLLCDHLPALFKTAQENKKATPVGHWLAVILRKIAVTREMKKTCTNKDVLILLDEDEKRLHNLFDQYSDLSGFEKDKQEEMILLLQQIFSLGQQVVWPAQKN